MHKLKGLKEAYTETKDLKGYSAARCMVTLLRSVHA